MVLPKPFWHLRIGFGRRGIGRAARLVLFLVVEFVLVMVLVFLVGTLVIPLAKPSVGAPTPTPVTAS